MQDLSWKWVTVAGIAAVVLVGLAIAVALTDLEVSDAVTLVTGTGLVGWIAGLNGPKKSAEDEARAKAKRVAEDTSKTQRGRR